SNGVSLHMANSTVRGNSGNIGTIFNGDSLLTLDHSSVSENRSTVGGAISGGGVITVTQSDLSGNAATFGEGGGIYYSGGSEGETGLELLDSTISDNSSAFEGGGVFTWTPAKVVITNSTISGNESGKPGTDYQEKKRGGGIFVLFGELELTNVTVEGNAAPVGGGVFNNEANAAAGQVTLRNTIVANSSGANCSGVVASDGHNLTSD